MNGKFNFKGASGTESAEGVDGVTVETRSGKFAQTVRAGKHAFIADEPSGFGGDDLGPGPYDLLLAALGTCTSMTVKLYADRKGIALDGVKVALKHRRDHAADCTDCENPAAKIDIIDRTIAFTGDIPADERQALLAIADKCPVHKTLTSQVEINTIED